MLTVLFFALNVGFGCHWQCGAHTAKLRQFKIGEVENCRFSGWRSYKLRFKRNGVVGEVINCVLSEMA